MSEPNGSPWPTLPLRSLAAEMCLGKMLDKAKNRGTLQPYLRNVNVRWFSFDLSDLKEMRFEEGEGSRFELREGDLVICEGGEPGRAAVWKGQTENARIQKALHRIRFRTNEYDPAFAMYFIYYGTITNRFVQYYTGTTIKHLTGKALSRVPFPILSITEQRRIVARIEELFSNLDAGVAALERAKANLKRYRAAVLKAAVEGKLTAEWRAKHPKTEPASKLLERILVERRKKWEADQLAKFAAAGKEPPKNWKAKYVEPTSPDATDLPELPEGWCWATLGQLNQAVRPMSYGVLQPGPDTPDGVPLVRVCDIADGKVAMEVLKRIDPSISNQFRRTILQGGEILLTIVGTIGRTAIASPDLRGANTARAVAVIPLTKAVEVRFVEIILRESGMRSRLTQAAHEVARKTLNLEDIQVACIPLPSLAEQQQIVIEVDERLSVTAVAEQQVETDLLRATRLRQSILKQAFEGKLVSQDPKDEPASELLERLRASRSAHAGNGRPEKATKNRIRRAKSVAADGGHD